VHLLGFIIKTFVTMHGHMNVKLRRILIPETVDFSNPKIRMKPTKGIKINFFNYLLPQID